MSGERECPNCHHALHGAACDFRYDHDESDFGRRAGQPCDCCYPVPTADPRPDAAALAERAKKLAEWNREMATYFEHAGSKTSPALFREAAALLDQRAVAERERDERPAVTRSEWDDLLTVGDRLDRENATLRARLALDERVVATARAAFGGGVVLDDGSLYRAFLTALAALDAAGEPCG